MAKVTAPLLSFTARGQIAGTLVYFPWKGIDAVRSYVVPANPNSSAQQTQRGYFGDAVDLWHSLGLTADDRTAWNRYATTLPTPQSGFNAFVREYINLRVGGLSAAATAMGFDGSLVDDADGTFTGEITEDGSAVAVDMLWGTSPTALLNVTAASEAVNVWTAAPATQVPGQTIYARFRVEAAANAIIGWSGIYRLVMA